MTSQDPRAPLRHAIDHLAVRNGRLLGWGWMLSSGPAVVALHLRVEGPGTSRRFAADLGTPRDDIARAFPDVPNAATSGFMVTGFVAADDARQAWLEVSLADGTKHEIDASAALDTGTQRPARSTRVGNALRAAWRRLRAGDIRGLWQRLVARTPDVANASWIARHWVPRLADAPACVVFDHDMGGGANRYRERLVAERLAAGQPVVLVTYRIAQATHEARLLRHASATETAALDRVEAIEPLFARGRVAEAVINSPVSFDDPAGLARWLGDLRGRATFRLLTTVHDYFPICRSFVLIDAGGRHCGVPAIDACERCMAANAGSFMNLSPPTPIAEWRAAWSRCLHASDEIRCFSRSSRDLLLRAYPDLPRDRLTVVPHDTSDIAFRPATHDPSGPLVIGVIGEVKGFKGATVVAELARLAEASPSNVRVVVMGSLEPPVASPRLTVTGRYRRDDLPSLVERHGVNMLFFPSVWPETFSYVAAEMMALRLPVVAFDIGAPAERLAAWPLARLCESLDARAAYDLLVSYHRERAEQAA